VIRIAVGFNIDRCVLPQIFKHFKSSKQPGMPLLRPRQAKRCSASLRLGSVLLARGLRIERLPPLSIWRSIAHFTV